MASKNTSRMNTPGEQNKEDNTLLAYRVEQVEKAVKEFGAKLDKQENIKKADLIEFRDTIVSRVNEIRDGLQKQIDEKADQAQVNDLRTLVKAFGAFLSTVIAALVIAYFTKGN
jgi:hypothetical protein